MIDMKDLVYLLYANNSCYVLLSEEMPEGVGIDLKKGEWIFEGRSRKIGSEERSCERGSRWGIIGVYDRTVFDHLQALVADARDAVYDHGSLVGE